MTETEVAGSAAGRLLDMLLRVAGGLVAVLGGFGTGALAVLLAPLRVADLPVVGGLVSGAAAVRVPVAVAIAICGALAVTWFVKRATGLRWGGVLPMVGWLMIIVVASTRTDEGDRLLMPGDWVVTLTIFGGTVVLVVGLVAGLVSPARPAPAVPAAVHRTD